MIPLAFVGTSQVSDSCPGDTIESSRSCSRSFDRVATTLIELVTTEGEQERLLRICLVDLKIRDTFYCPSPYSSEILGDRNPR